MSIPITSWLRAFFALYQCAADSRGTIEIRNDEDDPIRWPRTIGSDVVAIAAVFDPYIRQQRFRFGGYAIARQWRACSKDIKRIAARASNAEYTENRTFWNTLPGICVFLHAHRTPLPAPDLSDALLARLAEASGHVKGKLYG